LKGAILAEKSVSIGPLTNWLTYDDADFNQAATFPDKIKAQGAPTDSDDVLRLTEVGGGGPVAPEDATYLVVSLDGDLSQERVLTAGTGISIVDGGANGAVTISATDITTALKIASFRA